MSEKAHLRFSVLGKYIGQSFLDSIKCKAFLCDMKEPILTVENDKPFEGFSVVCLEVPEAEKLFWLGFIQGSHFTIDNRQQWELQ